jgi:hypothetical protein
MEGIFLSKLLNVCRILILVLKIGLEKTDGSVKTEL